ncbi:flagellar hook-length control protein FliK [Undibacterium sp. SXout20W]|uniref:flagellar hook-length control protein FliK n=1 Tax=Undibacterium sp. SXout20W TaxID=3413051 RepID=UPI003BF38967
MKTANIASVMINQNGASAAPKSNPVTTDENSFNAHFSREMSSTQTTNSPKPAKSSDSSSASKPTDTEKSDSTASNTASTGVTSNPSTTAKSTNKNSDKNSDKNKNNSPTEDTNPLISLINAMAKDPNATNDANIASGATEISQVTNTDVFSTATQNIAAQQALAQPNNAKITAPPSEAANGPTVAESDPTKNQSSALFAKTLSDAVEPETAAKSSGTEPLNNVSTQDISSKGKNDVNLAKIEGALTAIAQNKADKLPVAITPQATAQLTNLAQMVQATGTTANMQIPQNVGSTGWDKAVGQKVLWMVGESIHSAELSLNPPDLGPLQIVLKVSNEHASASFMCAQPEVREALESSMHKLRQMMSDAGIQLSGFTVNTQASNQGQPGNGYRPASQDFAQTSGSGTKNTQIEQLSSSTTTPTRVFTSRIGEVDTFA